MDPSLPKIIWYGFTAAAAVQIAYYLFFFSRLAFYRTGSRPPAEDETPEVSIVICAKNDNRSLERNLPVVLQQRYQDAGHRSRYEVLVVNDNSDDDTLFTLKHLEPGYPHFRYLNLTQSAKGIPGKKYPLTMGIRTAAHECLLLTDADCRPASTRWLSHMAGGFRDDKQIVLGYGAYETHPGLLNKVIRFETFFSAQQFLSFALAGLPYMGVGRNLAYRKALFFRHKGFLSHHNLPSGDDDLFINQAATGRNTRVVIHPEAITYSVPKTSWGAWYRQKTRHMSTGRHYRFIHSLLLGVFALSQALYYPLFVATLVLAPAFREPAVILFAARLMLQLVFWPLSLKKLNEKGLLGYCLVFDVFLWLYYLVFAAAVIRKPRMSWN
jgi:cellulose synthase/poly-beta-1,6-N-acetylglucosamine synthase-like glycosyltransferase